MKLGFFSPLLFEKKKYSQYDYLDLSLSKLGTLENKRRPKKVSMFPSGDICVEAVNATAMLIKKSIIKKVAGVVNGDTKIEAGDILVLFGSAKDIQQILEM